MKHGPMSWHCLDIVFDVLLPIPNTSCHSAAWQGLIVLCWWLVGTSSWLNSLTVVSSAINFIDGLQSSCIQLKRFPWFSLLFGKSTDMRRSTKAVTSCTRCKLQPHSSSIHFLLKFDCFISSSSRNLESKPAWWFMACPIFWFNLFHPPFSFSYFFPYLFSFSSRTSSLYLPMFKPPVSSESVRLLGVDSKSYPWSRLDSDSEPGPI